MGQINLANSRGRDATVTTETVAGGMTTKWVGPDGRAARPVRILRGTTDRDLESTASRAGGIDKAAAELIAAAPDVDIETFGTPLGPTSRVYVSPERQAVTKVEEWEVVRNPDGSERERRLRKINHSNTHVELPLRWSGKLMKKADVVRRFVLAAKLQITH